MRVRARAPVRRVLQAGRIRGAALDVFEVEPLPADSALWRLPNVLLSPHCADRTADFQLSAMRAFADNARRYMAGQPLENLVDKARARGRAMPGRVRLALTTRCAAHRLQGTDVCGTAAWMAAHATVMTFSHDIYHAARH